MTQHTICYTMSYIWLLLSKRKVLITTKQVYDKFNTTEDQSIYYLEMQTDKWKEHCIQDQET